ncbi:MAG TPA: glycosyltransferase family 2 protein [Gaiellaceae bacterium]|nr:glycosyltransferase family 2 protein [Gaiellaceae bacterium]
MSATVIVPSWNGAARLRALLPSLGSSAQVIVVDNGSTDGTRDLLSTQFPDVDAILLPRNEGFSRAVNRAAKEAHGDVLVLVNDDCVCEPGFVERLAEAIEPGRSVVMAAGVLLEVSDPTVIDTAGMELDDTLLVFDYLNGQPLSALADAPAPFGPSGAAAAFDRAAFLDVGGFDEQLFAYWEDVDLVLRLRSSGAVCAGAATARALHAHSATLGSGSSKKNYLTGFGRGYVLRKWGVLEGRRRFLVPPRELAICMAQLAVDRTVTGFTGRAAGWRAAAEVERREYPAGLVSGRRRTLAELRRRRARRRRLRLGARPT